METSELLKKVRKIEIKTKGLTKQIFAGQYHSAFKGKGMAFSEVREYQYGDDIRSIDWNVTARFSSPYIKIYDEERELTVILLIDMSHSHQFGTSKSFKDEMLTEMAAVLSFSAIKNNDKVGVIFFTNKVEKFIPPKKGVTHILRIISELIDFQPQNSGTDISEALRFLTNAIKKRSTAFILSDFIDHKGFEDAIKIANKKHDVIAVKVNDIREQEIPDIGFARIRDAESGKLIWVDTSDLMIRKRFFDNYIRHELYLKDVFSRTGVDVVNIKTGQDYIKPLMNFFKKRGKR
ncbi:MAG: hypothetical protein BWY70_00328 [Bacteroidetes bacterium ADurb.Bin408]|nr:MAG: hypothetical protein BWY70_00328 [Bacteroidetes bacterium ADurb.Bin408]